METFLSFLHWKTGRGVDDVSQLVRNNERQRNNNHSFTCLCVCVCQLFLCVRVCAVVCVFAGGAVPSV